MKARFRISALNLLAASAGRVTRTPDCLRILTFHDIRGGSDDIYGVSKERLADFLHLLKDEGYANIRAADIIRDWPLVLARRKTVVLTFDDGYSSHLDVVACLLQTHHMTGTFFVVSSLVGVERKKARFAGEPREFLCTRDLRELQRSGFEIGSHSHSHPLCGTIPREQVYNEINASKEVLQEKIGRAVTAFAYPFGRRGAYSAETRSALAASGFKAAFTQEGFSITSQTDPLEIPRVSIDRFDTPRTFQRKLNGWYETGERLRKAATRCLRLA